MTDAGGKSKQQKQKTLATPLSEGGGHNSEDHADGQLRKRTIDSPQKKRPKEADDAWETRDETTAASSSTATAGPATKEKRPPKKKSWLERGSSLMVFVFLAYFAYAFRNFYRILHPDFPDVDPGSGKPIKKFDNVFRPGDIISTQLWVSDEAFPGTQPIKEFKFPYDITGFEPFAHAVVINISQVHLKRGKSPILSAVSVHEKSGQVVRAQGNLVKDMKRPEVKSKFMLLRDEPLSSEVCLETKEPQFGKQKKGVSKIARGIPQMQVRLVFDETSYPHGWAYGPYTPKMYVDEFWLTEDVLKKFNMTGENNFDSEVLFSLMGTARWRFQTHMEKSLEMNAKLFGEDSEEMLQMRDLFANTNGYLLATTLVVSVLHLVFEFLAFKNDVAFFQNVDAESLNKYVSIQSIVVGILFQFLLLLYLWDESANLLVLGTSLVSIAIDMWKVQRAMKLTWFMAFGVLPLPSLEAKVSRPKGQDNYDSIAMKYLTMGLLPFVCAYGVYTLVFDCHRGWYSYFLTFGASCVYSLGFVLMTPQVFINYQHKTVAFLPWRKFIYRAINTFIDDLFAFIIKMPTMHRLSVFRDDIVFLVYLYQRWIYPADMGRSFDEDGYELASPPEGEEATHKANGKDQ